MKDLRVFLDYYIAKTLQTHPALHNLNVVVSDSDVPGEGEHKIMEFIRSQRTQPDYSPSQSHIIHGLDADLSMLALSSHEPNFFILVEQLFSCALCHLRSDGPQVPFLFSSHAARVSARSFPARSSVQAERMTVSTTVHCR